MGTVQAHCENGELEVEFKQDTTTLPVIVKAKQVREKLFTVLCIDGGGIRGIIPAVILSYIERQMECLIKERLSDGSEKEQLRIANFFDLIAGTSTGGIIALALTKPGDWKKRPEYTAEQLVDLYMNEGKNIFKRSTGHRIRSGGGLLNKKYPAGGIQKVLEEYFGDTRLDQAITDVLIPTYDMRGARVHWRKDFDCRRGGHPRFFKNYSMKDSKPCSENSQKQSTDCSTGDSSSTDPRVDTHLMRDVARATSAAPTYF